MSDLIQLESDLPPVSIVRRKQQRTMRIRVKNDRIVVSGPAFVSTGRLMDFVREKSGWIRKTYDLQLQKSEQLRKQLEAQKGTLLLRGERKNIYPFPVPGIRKPQLTEHERAIVFQYDPVSGLHMKSEAGGIHGIPENGEEITPGPDVISSFYLDIARRELRLHFNYWTDRLPFQPKRLSIRNQKTKWGSCSSRGTISLNWRLIKCPETIIKYIIIHELCHLKHFNHSKAFWKTVACYYSDIKKARGWIRKHSDEIFTDY